MEDYELNEVEEVTDVEVEESDNDSSTNATEVVLGAALLGLAAVGGYHLLKKPAKWVKGKIQGIGKKKEQEEEAAETKEETEAPAAEEKSSNKKK